MGKVLEEFGKFDPISVTRRVIKPGYPDRDIYDLRIDECDFQLTLSQASRLWNALWDAAPTQAQQRQEASSAAEKKGGESMPDEIKVVQHGDDVWIERLERPDVWDYLGFALTTAEARLLAVKIDTLLHKMQGQATLPPTEVPATANPTYAPGVTQPLPFPFVTIDESVVAGDDGYSTVRLSWSTDHNNASVSTRVAGWWPDEALTEHVNSARLAFYAAFPIPEEPK